MPVDAESCLLQEYHDHCHDLIKRCRPEGGCDHMCGVVRENLEDLDLCPRQEYINCVKTSRLPLRPDILKERAMRGRI